jgi:hypothetical protein
LRRFLLQSRSVSTGRCPGLGVRRRKAQGWRDGEEDRQYISDNYLELAAFFRRAARAGDAMLLYLN